MRMVARKKNEKRSFQHPLPLSITICYNVPVVAPILATERGGVPVETIFSFLVSVMASIVAYYVCKWLDRNDSDN